MCRGQYVNHNSSFKWVFLSDDQLSLTGDQLKCVLINARSLKNKLPKLYELLYSCSVDCVFITETWLNNNITSGLLDPDNKYEVMRNDRLQLSGGGVCAIVKKCLHTRHISITTDMSVWNCSVVTSLGQVQSVAFLWFTGRRIPHMCMIISVVLIICQML